MMANMDNLDQMTDEQLQMAIDEMKKNKALAKDMEATARNEDLGDDSVLQFLAHHQEAEE